MQKVGLEMLEQPVIDLMNEGGDGAVWRSGSGAPANGLGANGDYYLNTANGDVYEKASGTYSIVANIKGPTGNTGSQGSQGAQGAQGPQGEQGEQGEPGADGGLPTPDIIDLRDLELVIDDPSAEAANTAIWTAWFAAWNTGEPGQKSVVFEQRTVGTYWHRITVPFVDYESPHGPVPSITFRGLIPIVMRMGSAGTYNFENNVCWWRTASTTQSVISFGNGPLNAPSVFIENLHVSGASNGTARVIDLRYGNQAVLTNILGDYGLFTDTRRTTFPGTNPVIEMPIVGNTAECHCTNVGVQDGYIGLKFSEHFIGHGIYANGCEYGIDADGGGGHGMNIYGYDTSANKYNVGGRDGSLAIYGFRTERNQETWADFHDDTSTLLGQVYDIVTCHPGIARWPTIVNNSALIVSYCGQRLPTPTAGPLMPSATALYPLGGTTRYGSKFGSDGGNRWETTKGSDTRMHLHLASGADGVVGMVYNAETTFFAGSKGSYIGLLGTGGTMLLIGFTSAGNIQFLTQAGFSSPGSPIAAVEGNMYILRRASGTYTLETVASPHSATPTVLHTFTGITLTGDADSYVFSGLSVGRPSSVVYPQSIGLVP